MSSNTSHQAQELKLQGNKFYGNKQFKEAFRCYREASLLEPENHVYLANQSAVAFEAGIYGKCISLCDEALLKMGEVEDTTGLGGRLKLRKARSLFLLGKYADALSSLNQHPQHSVDEWNQLMRATKEFETRDSACLNVENAPLAFECSVPSVRGSLLPPFYHFDDPTNYQCPLSILQPTPITISALPPSQTPKFEKLDSPIDLLFAHNGDARHILETLKHAHLASKSSQSPQLNMYSLEQNPKALAKIIFTLFVLGHPDLDDVRSRHAADFVYFAWASNALIPPHWTMLRETLHELCKLSFNLDTWRMDQRTSWIQFADERDLKMVRDCWIVWGTATEDAEQGRSGLKRRMDQLKAISTKSTIQKAKSNMADRNWTRSAECTREMAFFSEHRILLPRPPLLEGDTALPPASMPSWLLNPLVEVFSTEQSPEERWNPDPRPDSLFPFGTAQSRDDLTPFSLFAHDQLYETIMAIRQLKKDGRLMVKAMCGTLVDLLDVGSRLGSEPLLFDRIHTGHLSDALGVLETFVNATLCLKNVRGAAFIANLSTEFASVRSSSAATSEGKTTFDSIDHLLFNKIRLERTHLSARFGLELDWQNDPTLDKNLRLTFRRSTIVGSAFTEENNENDALEVLERIEALTKHNELYKTEHLINNWFAQCCEPPSAAPVLKDGPCLEPAAPNLSTFCRLLTLLLNTDTPTHWITQAVERLVSSPDAIKASVLSDPAQPLHSRKPQSLVTTPYLTELSTLLTMAPGRRLWKAGLQLPPEKPGIVDIASCHWFQAENIKVQNFPPTRKIPHNPSIAILIVDRRIHHNSKTTLVERLSTVEGRSSYHDVLREHADNITVVSSVYWTGPPKVTEPSQVTLGFWLPGHFTAFAKPSSSFSLLIFRLDLYLCIGISSLASMACTTGDLEE